MANNGLANNKFFIIGKLELLDTPGEWFYDSIHQLYFSIRRAENKQNGHSIKVQDHGVILNGAAHIDWKIFPSMLVISTLATLTI